jgi:hypothetical protein
MPLGSLSQFNYYYAEFRYAECRYAECRCAECLGALVKWFKSRSTIIWFLKTPLIFEQDDSRPNRTGPQNQITKTHV